MRRVLLWGLLAASLGGAVAAGAASASRAEAQTAGHGPLVDLVKVEGVIDPALSDYVRGSIRQAARDGSTVILQIDSRGSYGNLAPELARSVRGSGAPVIAWIGPSGARAEGGSLFLVYAADVVAMAPGAGLGPARPFDLGNAASGEPRAAVDRAAGEIIAEGVGGDARPEGVRRAVFGPSLAAGPARSSGAVQVIAPAIGDLLHALDGREIRTAAGSSRLETLSHPGRPVTVRFHEMGPVRRLLHAVSTPTAVYVLLILGLWGMAFEWTQPAFGVAGLAGAAALSLAGYGLAVIPVHWLGPALILGGVALQALDVVIRRVALLTGAGTVAFLAGSLLGWHGVAPAIDLPLWLIALFTVAGFLFFGFALTVALRSRQRATEAQVGLVGLVGEVRTDLDPEGGVYVKGSLWRARSNDGPIPKGTRVRVRGLDGLILRVERDPDPPH